MRFQVQCRDAVAVAIVIWRELPCLSGCHFVIYGFAKAAPLSAKHGTVLALENLL